MRYLLYSWREFKSKLKEKTESFEEHANYGDDYYLSSTLTHLYGAW